jgi:tetratricopeptide (TPR) repeat protein
LADAYPLHGRRGDVAPNEPYPTAVENALHVLRLDPALAEPHAALGSIRQEYEWKWTESESEFQLALERSPSYSRAHSWYALFLGHMGRSEAAVSEAVHAQELDPLSHRVHTGAAEEFIFARRYEDAIRPAERALEVEPTFGPAHAYIAQASVELGAPDRAIREFKEAGRLLGAQAWMGRLGHAYALSGRTSEARRIIDQLKEGFTAATPGNPFRSPTPYASLDIGLVHLGLGETDTSIDWFQRARDDRVPEVVHFRWEPIYDPLQREPRFRAILRSIGMAD